MTWELNLPDSDVCIFATHKCLAELPRSTLKFTCSVGTSDPGSKCPNFRTQVPAETGFQDPEIETQESLEQQPTLSGIKSRSNLKVYPFNDKN